MDKPKRQQALVLVVVAVLSAVGAARWEVVATADEQAADRIAAVTATRDSQQPAAHALSHSATSPSGPSAPGRSQSEAIRSELAAMLAAIDRLAPPTTPPDAATPAAPTTGPEERGEAALASISYPWEELLPGWQIHFYSGIDGAFGYTLTGEKTIEIYIRDGQSDELIAHVIAHELGHAVDVTLNDREDRERWQAARGLDGPWWPDSRASDFATGAGDFAESFAAWQVGTQSFRSQLGGPPTDAQLTLIAELAAG